MTKANMKNLLLASALLFTPAAAAAAEYDGFFLADAASLKPFARDLGGLLGSGSIQTARSLGFSGFDVGVRAAAQLKPSSRNTLVKKNSVFGLGVVQAEIGMPYRIDGFVRGGAYDGIGIAGGGLRYGLWNISDDNYKINATMVVMSNVASHKYFHAVTLNAGLVASMNMGAASPFVGVGLDSTRLDVTGVSDPVLRGRTVSVVEPRYSLGLRLKMDLAYLSAGATYTHDSVVVSGSTGVRF